MQDHYVEVHNRPWPRTGSELRPCRTRINPETEGVGACASHRSHWVARAAVEGVERRGWKAASYACEAGTELPVSRSYSGGGARRRFRLSSLGGKPWARRGCVMAFCLSSDHSRRGVIEAEGQASA